MPIIVREVSDELTLQHALVENLHRDDLNPLEEAAAYQQLIEDFGMTQEAVSQRVGKSRSSVANLLRLFQLPPQVQRLVADGQVSAGHAKALLGTPDRSFQESLARRIVADGLTVRETEEAVRLRSSAAPDPRRVRERGDRQQAPCSWAARARGAAGRPARHPGEDRHGPQAGPRGHRVRRSRGPRADLQGHVARRLAGACLTRRVRHGSRRSARRGATLRSRHRRRGNTHDIGVGGQGSSGPEKTRPQREDGSSSGWGLVRPQPSAQVVDYVS